MDETFEIITVDADNLDRHGFFCYMSKRKAPGYAQKCAWLAARFAEGLKLHMVHETGGRTVGFIETSRASLPGGRFTLQATWSSTVCGWWARAKARVMVLGCSRFAWMTHAPRANTV